MSETTFSRRSAFKILGLGALGMPVPSKAEAPAEAFRFSCHCSRQLVAKVPPSVGDVVDIECHCRVKWALTWKGDHFSVVGTWPSK